MDKFQKGLERWMMNFLIKLYNFKKWLKWWNLNLFGDVHTMVKEAQDKTKNDKDIFDIQPIE